MLFCIAHKGFPVIANPQETILSNTLYTHTLSTKKITLSCNLVFTMDVPLYTANQHQVPIFRYKLCFLHEFLHSAENVKSRVVFCYGLGLCNSAHSIRALPYLAL